MVKVKDLNVLLQELDGDVEILFETSAGEQLELMEITYRNEIYGSKRKTATFMLLREDKSAKPLEKEGKDSDADTDGPRRTSKS